MEPVKPTPETPKEKRLWFRAKTYGYGWYPASWQGWSIVVLYLLSVLYSARGILSGTDVGVPAVKRFLLTTFILTLFLFHFAYIHGEKLKWRWGKTDTPHDDNPYT